MLLQESYNSESLNACVFGFAPLSEVDGPGKRAVLFFQGCNSHCEWCHSPHSQLQRSPLLFFEERCTLCGLCVKTCPNGVHRITDGIHTLSREYCIQCGACIDSCPLSSCEKDSGALHLPSKIISVDSLYHQIKIYFPLCDGITLSGGEALIQLEASEQILKYCKADNIPTAVETSGTLKEQNYKTVLPLVDTWLFGFRIITKEGEKPNAEKIAATLELLKSRKDAAIIPRIPMIPRIFDQKHILTTIIELLKEYHLNQVWLNPWNTSYDVYYTASGIPLNYTVPQKQQIENSQQSIINYFRSNNINILNYNK